LKGLEVGRSRDQASWRAVGTSSPAAATTLIISLGILPKPTQQTFLMLAVFGLVVQGVVINRLAR